MTFPHDAMPKLVLPVLHGVMAHLDAALAEQVFDSLRRERKQYVQHHCQTDEHGLCL